MPGGQRNRLQSTKRKHERQLLLPLRLVMSPSNKSLTHLVINDELDPDTRADTKEVQKKEWNDVDRVTAL